MTKKLKILGPYTPEHPGPFCTRDGRSVEVKFHDGRGSTPLAGYVENETNLLTWQEDGRYYPRDLPENQLYLMNAEEAPVAREFWLVGGNVYYSQKDAEDYIAAVRNSTMSRLRTIHVREVLPGDGE